jgi:PrtD family type I secretion system ABC transporter
MTFTGPHRLHGRLAENPILSALAESRSAIGSLVIFSGIINLLMLTGSFYMLQVYDRVLLSYSVPTLVVLSIITLCAFVFLAFLDVVRTRIFGRIAERVELSAGPKVFTRLARTHAHRPGMPGEKMQPFRDIDNIRSFLSGPGPVAAFDIPWLPLYLVICFALHPIVGLFTTFSAALLIAVAIHSEYSSKKPTLAAFEKASHRNLLAAGTIDGSEAVMSMGMLESMLRRWSILNSESSQLALAANDTTSSAAAVARILRMGIQSATLGLGAYLVIKGEMTAGTIIAASIISTRAIAPVDMAVNSYKAFQQAHQSYNRLITLFRQTDEPYERITLMAPSRFLSVENIVVSAPSNGAIILKGVSFHLAAGEGLGVIGQSASGKSTLGRAIVGLWHPLRGVVALDGAALTHWNEEQLGRHVGYLPHDVQLFDGTVAENISRFETDAPADRLFIAAQSADCFELIQQLPEGFNTRIGVGGMHLSAGQKQRIGLARALYGDPFLLVLDEPNSNLDARGEAAVTKAMFETRSRGGIVVVIAHRPSAVQAVDKLLVLRDGMVSAYGDKAQVLQKMVSNASEVGVIKSGKANGQTSAPPPRLEDGGSGASRGG